MNATKLGPPYQRVRLKYALATSVPSLDPHPEDFVTFCPMEAIGEYGSLDTAETRLAETVSSGYTRFRDGDVLVAKITPCFENGKGAIARGLTNGIGYGTTELYVLTPRSGVSSRFLYYVTASSRFRLLGEASMTGAAGQKRVPAEFVSDYEIWLPKLQVQDRIADYLDAETARIDGLIAQKEQFLALLDEKRAAVVTQAVTHGLDPKVRMRPSGLGWTGEVPAHWRVMRLKHFTLIGNGSTPNMDNFDYWQGGDFPWLNSSVVGDRPVKEPSRLVTELALRECHLPVISPPAVLVAITGQGKTRGRSTVLEFEATINQHLAFVKPEPGAAECLYLSLLLDAAYTFLRSDSDGAGSTRGAITCEQLGNFRVPVPPIDEQRSILSHIDESVRHFAEVEKATADSIALLRERRSAVITAAVTGAIPLEGVR